MFERTKDYNATEAKKLAEKLSSEGPISNFLELFYCFFDLGQQNDTESFRQVNEAVLEGVVNRNLQYPRERVRFETLSHLWGLCLQSDIGKIVIGFPLQAPEHPGKTLQQFLGLYEEELKKGEEHYPPLPKGSINYD